MTMVRSSTRTICCTIGISRISPGPFTFQNRPSWNTTPRSYSRSTLTALIRIAAKKTITGK